MTAVVGLVGEIAAGKGEAVKFLEKEYDAVTFRFSDILKKLLEQLSMPVTRENLQSLGRVLRRLFGDIVLIDALRHDIEEANAKMIVVDGVRYQVEADMVKSFENSMLVYITADEKTRYERARSRATRGEENITFNEFLKNGENETEKSIKDVGAKADATIQNTGTIRELHEKIRGVIKY